MTPRVAFGASPFAGGRHPGTGKAGSLVSLGNDISRRQNHMNEEFHHG